MADGTRTLDLAVADGRIEIPPRSDGVRLRAGLFVSPALVDAHCHCIRMRDLPAVAAPGGHRRTVAAALDRCRAAGTGAIRDAGDASGATVAPLARRQSPLERPRLISCGAFISGPTDHRPGVIACADHSAFERAVAGQARISGGWVKLIGDRIDQDGIVPTLPARWIATAVSAASSAGARVAIHAMAADTIETALDAGVASIEHGTEITPAEHSGSPRCSL
jgi:imidazolonepropionase-like amidohydrolase